MKYFHSSENLIHNETVYFLRHYFTFFSTTEVAEFANQPLMNTMEMLERQEELRRLPEAVSFYLFLSLLTTISLLSSCLVIQWMGCLGVKKERGMADVQPRRE
jgi:hypothetical protein